MARDDRETSAGPAVRAGGHGVPRLEHVRVRDAMHPGITSVRPETPLREVALVLASRHIHCVLVAADIELGGRPSWSLISALDLVRAMVADAERSFDDRVAADIAEADPPTVSANDDLERAARLMGRLGAEHVIVVAAEDGRPVGVLSTLDVAGVIAGPVEAS